MNTSLGKSPYRAIGLIEAGTFDPRVDALVTASDTHVLVLWFVRIAGEWEVVAFDSTPSAGRKAWPRGLEELHEWLAPSAARIASLLDQGKTVQPVTQADVRGIPLRSAASYRASSLLDSAVRSAPTLTAANRRSGDARAFDVLQDALYYDQAISTGVSGRHLIALRRGVSPSAADQRIGRARVAGYLSDTPGRDGSYLTKSARAAIGRLTADSPEG